MGQCPRNLMVFTLSKGRFVYGSVSYPSKIRRDSLLVANAISDRRPQTSATSESISTCEVMDKGDQFDRDSTQPIRGPKKDRLRPAVNI